MRANTSPLVDRAAVLEAPRRARDCRRAPAAARAAAASRASASLTGPSAACSSASLAATSAMLASAVGCSQSGKRARRPPASMAARAADSTTGGAPIASTSRSFGRAATRVSALTGSSISASLGSASSAATTPCFACASAWKSTVLSAISRSACSVSVEFGQSGFDRLPPADQRIGVVGPPLHVGDGGGQRVAGRAPFGGQPSRRRRPVGLVGSRAGLRTASAAPRAIRSRRAAGPSRATRPRRSPRPRATRA